MLTEALVELGENFVQPFADVLISREELDCRSALLFVPLHVDDPVLAILLIPLDDDGLDPHPGQVLGPTGASI